MTIYAIAQVNSAAFAPPIGGGAISVAYTVSWGDGLGTVLASSSGHITVSGGTDVDHIRSAVQMASAALILAGAGTVPATVVAPQDIPVIGL